MGALARPDHRHPPAPVITQPRDPSLAINHRLKLMVISMFEVPLVHGHALCPSPRSVGRWERDTAFNHNCGLSSSLQAATRACSLRACLASLASSAIASWPYWRAISLISSVTLLGVTSL